MSMAFTDLDNDFPNIEETCSTGSFKADCGDPESSDPLQEGVKAGSSSDSEDLLSSDSVFNPRAPTSGKGCWTGSKPNCCRDPESDPRQDRVKTSSSSDSEDSFSDNCRVNPRSPTSGKACVTFPTGPNSKKKASKPAEESRPKPPSGGANGPFCHICRRSQEHCARCPRCGLYFCKRCLALKHGEDVFEVSKPELQWVCPRCRKGCGLGCTKVCCTCSRCCHDKGIPPFGVRLMKEAQAADFNLHDHAVHVQTHESKEEIVHRKISHGWIKAPDINCRSSDFYFTGHNKNDDHYPAEHNPGSIDKRWTAGDESDDGRTTAPDNSSDSGSSDSGRKTQEILSSPNVFSSTSQSDDGLRNCNKKKQAVRCQINRMPVEEANSAKSDRKDCGRSRSPDEEEEEDNDTLSKDLSDSLVPFDDMAVNIYLMTIWLNREKVFEGNQMSVILSDKEVALKNAIKARSSAKAIAFEFHPARFMLRPRREQEQMKQRLTKTLINELDESNSRLQEFFAEAARLVAETSQHAQDVVDSTMDSITAAVEKGLDAILS